MGRGDTFRDNGYTPTTEEIRARASWDSKIMQAQFDRWLAALVQRVRVQTVDDIKAKMKEEGL